MLEATGSSRYKPIIYKLRRSRRILVRILVRILEQILQALQSHINLRPLAARRLYFKGLPCRVLCRLALRCLSSKAEAR